MSSEPKPIAPSTGGIEIGVVTKPHGVRGEVKVRLHNPASEALRSSEASPWLELPEGRVIDRVRMRGESAGAAIIAVQGVCSRDQAESLRGGRLMVPRQAIALEEGQYLYSDLVGCRVTEGERDVGRVIEVFEAGASDILVVRSDGDGTERLIPLVDHWVASVDLQAGEIEVVDVDSWDPVDD